MAERLARCILRAKTGTSMTDKNRWRVSPDDLYRTCQIERLPFQTTSELADVDEAPGQDRAVEAIRFGIGMAHRSYNLFAMGSEGLGRRTLVDRLLRQSASQRPTPPDWCYVFNFKTPHKPTRVPLPTGRALAFQHDMARLVEDLRTGIPAAFETDEYRSRRQELENELSTRQDLAIGTVGDHAREQKIALLRTPGGFGFAPMSGDGVMEPQQFQKLSEAEQKPIEEAIGRLQKELEAAIELIPKWRREAQRKLRELNRQITSSVVASLIEEMKATYESIPAVRDYLIAVQDDVLDHAEYFQQSKEGEAANPMALMLARAEPVEALMNRYAVNALVHHEATDGAPVVFEDHPTHDNLVGRIEYEARMGALVTEFTLIKGGALHRANGGYLIVEAIKLLTQPLAWEALKRALRAREIRIEPLAQALSLVSTVSLEPEPIPLDLKVVLIGPRNIYYLLHALDPEFSDLFKVLVDFDEDMNRNNESDLMYARLIATLARQHAIRPLDRTAVGRLIEHASRSADDSDKLSLEIARLSDLMLEANHLADAQGNGVMSAVHVQAAIDGQARRGSRISDRLREETLRGRLLIDTQGERIGQVNGLSVVQMGDQAFGKPVRITASVRLGGGQVIDIEREAQLGGPLHSKGVMILGGYLSGRYLPEHPLMLSASLVFEQSYGGVEGDSASSAELYALLSAIARVPLKQSFAVTGSVNQHGDVQPIGGVNDKIEGFFWLCQERGLTGEQGVIIPASNVRNLMLHHEVVAAVQAGRFHVHAVSRIDEGLELLTGLPAGERGVGGAFPPRSLNGLIEARLEQLAERLRPQTGGESGNRARQARRAR